MPMYRFAIHHRGAETEMLGTMGLRDDAEALAFATQIIHDMPDEDRAQGNDRSVGITDGGRAIGRISCGAGFEG
jgi:hypothetical protein